MNINHKKIFLILGFIIVFTIGILVGTLLERNNTNSFIKEQMAAEKNTQSIAAVQTTSPPVANPTDETVTFGSIIKSGDFTIVFLNYSIVPIDNDYSDFKEAIVISVQITNITDETQSMLTGITANCFAPNGTEASKDVALYLNDEYPSYWQDDLRAGAVYDSFLSVAYMGDGGYVIEVGTLFGDPIELYFDVVK